MQFSFIIGFLHVFKETETLLSLTGTCFSFPHHPMDSQSVLPARSPDALPPDLSSRI